MAFKQIAAKTRWTGQPSKICTHNAAHAMFRFSANGALFWSYSSKINHIERQRCEIANLVLEFTNEI